ncbi:hypothetical protein FNL55_11355 [Tardiphaga sp. vice352]|uniref:hypothetical protein n=1 Tax=unclassified Tardiphaga TaxID=2631404 RepID=UPI0011641AF6|nr:MULTISPECIES: hypothetical protein [unclassified Tardiphaga]MBC7584332.1 hypothetical protein [Tardiphaga sp.]QDM16573.1 hypothetical protein FNL53_12060 [Tardiphaga sp. vice278]QDM21597.1 hypothetical protein FIU28_10940 [Tardiphaga sp. vice154]QDM26783.1 hypothetical protein FNL56_12215 [Tardiphaga sp. vice304]QDM31846.1 hypothetical protein FNL55_11355 [Tardiphaga sp. vice352]
MAKPGEVADYIHEMCLHLAGMAKNSNMHTLCYLLQLSALEAADLSGLPRPQKTRRKQPLRRLLS